MKRTKKGDNDLLQVKGFFRAQRVCRKTGKIIGDTGFLQNQITNYGLNSCIAARPIGGGSAITSMVVGSGGTPAASDETLAGSNTDLYTSVATSMVASSTARMTAVFEGSDSSMAAVGNAGIVAASDGTLIAGVGFATSALATDQALNVTYELRYS